MQSQLIDPKKTAVVVIDLQNAYCSPNGSMSRLGFGVSHFEKMVKKIGEFLEAARRRGVPVIFFRMIEDPKYMAENARVKMKAEKCRTICSPNSFNFDYFMLRPQTGDMQFVKTDYDAFSNKGLERDLKRRRIKSLILVGGYTQVCIDSTLRSAFTKGYHVIVPRDLISGPVQRKSQEKSAIRVWSMFFAHMVKSTDIIKSWRRK